MTDEEVRAMNQRLKLGWEPSVHQWATVAQRCKMTPEMRSSPIWALRKMMRGLVIVAYAQFFHPTSIVARDLTYDEAEALKKLMES